MEHFVFGYGSLVNRRTLNGAAAYPARLSGWRRAWRHTDRRPLAYLTAIRDPASAIEGLILKVQAEDWPALDEREGAYLRVAADDVSHDLSGPLDVQVYHIPEDLHPPAPSTLPLLLSYIDVVVQGYLAEYGEAGVQAFFDTTDGWNTTIADDRAAPIYPRAQSLSARELALVDQWLEHRAQGREAFDQRRWWNN